jgi:putative ABC transport system substrate-binding protein
VLPIALVLAVLIGAGSAAAQPAGKVHRIGFLSYDAEPSPMSRRFLEGLRELGYTEGRNFVIEYRSADGRSDRLPQLAADLVKARMDVIVTRGTAATIAARDATRSVPIVFGSAGVPVEKGIAASLAHPGGNVTGSALHAGLSKTLEVLKQAVPGAVQVMHLYDSSAFGPASFREANLKATQSHALSLGVKLQSVALVEPQGAATIFDKLDRGTDGVVLENAGLVAAKREQLCRLAVERRLPAVGRGRLFPDAGCLASYGEDVGEMYHRAAYFVDRILKGAKPGDLPIERATKFELVVNRKTARALGLTIPPELLLRADDVID